MALGAGAVVHSKLYMDIKAVKYPESSKSGEIVQKTGIDNTLMGRLRGKLTQKWAFCHEVSVRF